MVYCIGLTGTIASGKSTAATYFESRDVTLISADAIARALTARGQPAFDEIRAHFGQGILTEQGELNRRVLRQRILSDTNARHWLEACLHPRIRAAITRAVEHVTGPYCVIEIPLLTQRQDYPYLNRILLIEASEKQQIKRIQARDACSTEEAIAILAAQPHQKTHQALADDVIRNSGTRHALEKKIAAMHEKYLHASSVHSG